MNVTLEVLCTLIMTLIAIVRFVIDLFDRNKNKSNKK